MSITYQCDHCGALVDSGVDLVHRSLGNSRAEVDGDHPYNAFWEGDLCHACNWRLEVMRSRYASNAEWAFFLDWELPELECEKGETCE